MWAKLTVEDLKTALAQDEIDKLSQYSVELSTVIQDTLDQASDAYRGAFLGKSYKIDPRDHYTPSSYKPFILAFARHLLWTRFPMAEEYALGETRKTMLDQAMKLLEKPVIGVDIVDYEPQPGPEPTPTPIQQASSMFVPFQRFPDQPMTMWK